MAVKLFSSKPFTQNRTTTTFRRVVPVVCQATSSVETPTQQKQYHPSPLSQAVPSKYAIVEIGGTQMFVEPNKWYTCNRLPVAVGSKIKFGRVLAVKNGDDFSVGKPYVQDFVVEADVVQELRAPKIIVYKMRPKKHYRRKQGHRQDLSKFLVTKIEAA